MSNVVVFKPDRRPRPERTAEAPSAAILFFTGVRYMRPDEDEGPASPPRVAERPLPLLNAPADRLQA